MNATVLSFDYPNRKLSIQIESNSPMLEVRESGVLLGFISLGDIADQLIEKERKWAETSKDHDQKAIEIESKEYTQKKCNNCGHGIYSFPDKCLHENINEHSEGELDIKCQHCACEKPEIDKDEQCNHNFIEAPAPEEKGIFYCSKCGRAKIVYEGEKNE